MAEKFKTGDKVRLLPRNLLISLLDLSGIHLKRYPQIIEGWINHTKNNLDDLEKKIFIVKSSLYHQVFWECYWLALENNPDDVVCRYPAGWLCKVEEFKEIEIKFVKKIRIESNE